MERIVSFADGERTALHLHEFDDLGRDFEGLSEEQCRAGQSNAAATESLPRRTACIPAILSAKCQRGLPVYFLSGKRREEIQTQESRRRSEHCVGLPAASRPGSGAGNAGIAAHVKGPNQINLTWAAVADPGYGYLVEIQSADDSRFRAWTEMEPMPRAGGYTCDPNILARGRALRHERPGGRPGLQSPNHGVPYWVTEAQYADPQDDTPAQFIAWGLKPDTAYSFRVRSYSGKTSPVFGTYSNTARRRTAAYPVRYVSPAGTMPMMVSRRTRTCLAVDVARAKSHRVRAGADRDGRNLCQRRDRHGAGLHGGCQGGGAGQSRGHSDHYFAAPELGACA